VEFTQAETQTLSPDDCQRLWSVLTEVAAESELIRASAPELVELGATITRALPSSVLRALHRFRNRGTTSDALLLRNLIPADLRLPPTPTTLLLGDRDEATRMAEVCLLGVLSLLGEPFTFASLYGGRIVQDVVPVPGEEQAQTSGSSESSLDWHVEDAFSADRCDYFGLLCLRADPEATTTLAAVRRLKLRPEVVTLLREFRYAAVPDIAHGTNTDAPVPMAVLSGPDDDPEICFDETYMRTTDEHDSEASGALSQLATCVREERIGHVLAPGDLLIVDNRRVVHARTSFTPRYDGTDRWLLRAMVCSSLPLHRRRGAIRAIAS